MNLLMVEIAKWPQCAGTRLPKCSHAPGMVAPLAYPVPPPWGQLLESTLGGGQHPFYESEQKLYTRVPEWKNYTKTNAIVFLYSLVEWSNTNAIFIVKSNNKEIIIAWSHNMAHPNPKVSVVLP